MKRVFLMDDSAFALDITRVALTESGFEVTCGRDLGDLDRLQGQPVDLVLMDVEMPEAFGDDVTSWLRGQGLDAPLFLVSALPDDQLARRAADCGATGWIPKRLGVDGVMARVQEILGMGGASPSSAPQVLVEEFISIAQGRLRRAEGAAARGDLGAVGAELHLLSGEASLMGLADLAHVAELSRTSVAAAFNDTPLSVAIATESALAAVSAELGAAAHRARVPVAPRTAARGRLLLLDDSDFYRSTLMSLLEDAGYEVIEARRLADARHRMREGKFDAAILDLRLEDGRGTDLIPELRKHAPATKLLLLSGDTTGAHGADAVLPKSIDIEDLLREIATLIGAPAAG